MKPKYIKKAAMLLLLFGAITVTAEAQTFRSWAPTPPMGWNSWDCYGPTVTEDEVKANANYMAQHLKQYGWEYVVVDIRWFVANTKRHGYNEKDPVYNLDYYGRYMPAENRFPSSALGKGFKPLADYVHSLGLKFGIHIMRGLPKAAYERNTPIKGANGITARQIATKDGQCKWLHDNYTILADRPGAQEYYNSIMNLYASWGVDFIKVDDLSQPYHKGEIELIRKAIDQTGRPMVLSASPGETPTADAEHIDSHANMWRMVNDVWDKWSDLTHLMRVATAWYPYIGDGTWPDCDMLPLGHLAIRGERGDDRMTRLTPDEQLSLMTFFSIMRSPLMYGGDLPTMDDKTLSLLTNQSVLRMHRDSELTRQLYLTDTKLAVTSRNSKTGEVYVALFNIGDTEPETLSVSLKDLNLRGTYRATNLWSGKAMGKVRGKISQKLAPHQTVLIGLKQ